MYAVQVGISTNNQNIHVQYSHNTYRHGCNTNVNPSHD